ncbi:amino acid adenylation domain-containing protein, partial [Rhodococcus sp. NPDC059234]|uniref:amino acid adenylation domain-containing protein n=1 Tax=Rhodococcus sp. NPDC059234 TaxID=3346781 RepID=UPI00366FC41D
MKDLPSTDSQRDSAQPQAVTFDPDGPADAFPLSAVQRSVWFGQQLTPTAPIFIAQYVDLHGDVDLDLLRSSAVTAAREFQSPFLRLVDSGGEPSQVVDPSIDTSIELFDFRQEEDPLGAAHAWIDNDYVTPIQLTRDRLVEMTILQVTDRDYLWYTRIHHVALDGYSGMTMVNRIAALYTAASKGVDPEPSGALDLRTLYELDQKYRSSSRFGTDREYWAEHVRGIEAGSTLAHRDGPAAARSRLESAQLTDAALDRLGSSDARVGATSAALLIAAFACYLSRMTGSRDVLVNVPVSARTTAPLQHSGGMLVNVAPLRITVYPDDTVAGLVRRVQLELMGALRHQRCSLEDIRRDAGLTGARHGLAGPMVNVMLFRQEITLGSIVGEYHIVTSGPVQDLLVNIYQSGSPARTLVDFRGNPNRYGEDELRTHHRRFVELVEALLVAEPTTRLADIHAESAGIGARMLRENAELAFWAHELAGQPESAVLPRTGPAPSVGTGRGSVTRAFDRDLHKAATALAHALGIGPFTMLHTALAAVLSRLTDTDDIVVAAPVPLRSDPSPEGNGDGPSATAVRNTVALRTLIDPSAAFTDLARASGECERRAFAHQETPFERVVQTLDAPRPRVTIDVHAAESDAVAPETSELTVELTEHFTARGAPAGIDARLTYDNTALDEQTVTALIDRFERLLAGVAEDPDRPVGDVPLLAAAESAALTPVTGRGAVAPRTFARILADAVAVDPDHEAVVAGGRSLSYRELDELADALAGRLSAHGIGPDSVVALAIARSIESVAAVWAVARTGAAFLPVDPDYPADRIEHMLSDSGAALGLTVHAHRDALPETTPWLVLDDPIAEPDPPISADRAAATRPLHLDDAAYLIYTSGSTGLPKGVVVTHRGLANLAAEERERFAITADSRTLHFSSPSFDASVLELLMAAGAGATMVVAPPHVYGGVELADLLRRERVTHAFVTPAALASVDPAGLGRLECVVTGGDVCPPALVRQWAVPTSPSSREAPPSPSSREAPTPPSSREAGRRMFNAYGPTETTVVAGISTSLWPGAPVTIGGPSRGCGEMVLDRRLQPVPEGAVGELYVTGDGLARGYQHRPGLTAGHFVADPFSTSGGRMYRTGDLVRWHARASGAQANATARELEYLGRSDFQIKIRGFRIELGEIDAVLRAHPDVAFAATVGRTGPSGDTVLVGYVLPVAGAEIDEAALLAHAAESLPAHMVPAALVVLDRAPLSPAGKLDRDALPEPRWRGTTAEYRAPRTPTEGTVAAVFADLLGQARIGTDDSFFDLGGDSLVATRVIGRVNAALSVHLSVRDLFAEPTVAGLAHHADRILENADPGRPARERPALVARGRPDRLPLSPAQQRMWLVNQFDTASPAYNIPFAVTFTGELDRAALQTALGDVIGRHEALRTVFPADARGPYQVILPASDAIVDLTPVVVDPERVGESVSATAAAGFDVREGVPLRVALLRTGPRRHVLVVVLHHISADGQSVALLARDVAAAYAARAAGRAPEWDPLPLQYADYALWQYELLGAEADPQSLAARQLAYWGDRLADLPSAISLPHDRPRTTRASTSGDRIAFDVEAGIHRDLVRIAREHGCTLFMVLHAALAVLLARLGAGPDIAVGTPVAGRGEPELDDLVGMFVNTLVLRSTVRPEATFADMLAQVRETDLGAFANADLPFERLVDEFASDRSPIHAPLVQVLLEFQHGEPTTVTMPGLSAEAAEVDPGVAKFDLQLGVRERFDDSGRAAGLSATLRFATDLFDRATVAGIGDRLVRILAAAATDPTAVVGDIVITDEQERALVAHERPRRAAPTATLPELFASTAARSPDACAVVSGATRIRYADLAARANRLARLLIRHGVGPSSLVAVAMARSEELPVALLAVLTAGAAYVPVDVDYPEDRIAHVLADASPACVLVDGAASGSVLRRNDIPVVDLGDPAVATEIGELSPAPVTAAERTASLHPDSLAYVIYTSGSTGRPKGVAVSHRSVTALFADAQGLFRFGGDDVWTMFHSYAFDFAVWELWGALLHGGTVVLVDPTTARSPRHLLQLLQDESVTVLCQTPSAFYQLADAERTRADEGDPAALRLRYVIFGGEALDPGRLTGWFARRGDSAPQLVNMYGITETCVHVTHGPLTRASGAARRGSPIGRALPGLQVRVLDERLHVVPPGVVGELYVSGVQLARGYPHLAGETAARFVADPSGSGTRMYRTGDLGRWRVDGTFDYAGRADHQVQVRGYRVELGEVEAALAAVPGVAAAAVVADEGPVGILLLGYAVPDGGAVLDPDEVRGSVARALPAYMVPATVMILDRLPVTAHGKLDRASLPVPGLAGDGYVAPRNPVEEIVAGVITDLLGVDRVGADDGFFALGGNSLVSAQLVARINDATGAALGIRDVFDGPTVAELARRVGGEGSGVRRPPLVPRARPVRIPLSPAQQRMWFVNQFDPQSPAYNISFSLRLTGDLDAAALQAALGDVVARHESLRTVYPLTDDGPCQRILPADRAAPGLEITRVRDGDDLRARMRATLARGFDVAQQVPLRAELFRVDETNHVLTVAAHHILADGFSLNPLARDVAAAYAARRYGGAPQWPSLSAQYADYTLWQREWLGGEDDASSPLARQLDYWTTALSGLPEVLDLPSDRPRPAVRSQAGGRVEFTVDARLHRSLIALAHSRDASVFMVVHAALAALLSRLSGTDDIAVGTPIAGRGAAALDDLVGMFVGTLVLRSDVGGACSFGELLRRVRETDLGAFMHADIPFERVVEALDPPRSHAHTPLFQVMLEFRSITRPDLALPDLRVEPLDSGEVAANFDLQLTAAEEFDAAGGPAGMTAGLVFATDMFDEATVRTFADRFLRILAAVAESPDTAVADIDILDGAERLALTAIRGHPGAPPRTLA